MAIYTMHVNGAGVGDARSAATSFIEQMGFVAHPVTGAPLAPSTPGPNPQSIPAPAGSTTLPDGSTLLPDGSIAPPGVFSTGFLDTWGIPIAAGVGAAIVGLVLAKFTIGRKR